MKRDEKNVAKRNDDHDREIRNREIKMFQQMILRLLSKVISTFSFLIGLIRHLLYKLISFLASHRARDRSTEAGIRRTKKNRDVSSKRQRNRRTESNERPSAQV